MTHVISGMSPCGSVAISFRRNDNDRKPARVVFMPNDGPGATWEERVAASQARLAKLVKPRMVYETAVSDYVLLPLLAEIASGVTTQVALKNKLAMAASTVSGRCSLAVNRGLIEARRERSGPACNNTFYVLSQSGERFLEANRDALAQVPKSDGNTKRKPERLRPNILRNAILDAMMAGQWMSSAAISEAIGRDSNAVSAAARRCVEWGYLERDDTAGIGTKALYRITEAGRYFRSTGIA